MVLAALQNICVHRGKIDGGWGDSRSQQCCHTKGTPGLTQHKVNPPSHHSISKFKAALGVLLIITIGPLFLVTFKPFTLKA